MSAWDVTQGIYGICPAVRWQMLRRITVWRGGAISACRPPNPSSILPDFRSFAGYGRAFAEYRTTLEGLFGSMAPSINQGSKYDGI